MSDVVVLEARSACPTLGPPRPVTAQDRRALSRSRSRTCGSRIHLIGHHRARPAQGRVTPSGRPRRRRRGRIARSSRARRVAPTLAEPRAEMTHMHGCIRCTSSRADLREPPVRCLELTCVCMPGVSCTVVRSWAALARGKLCAAVRSAEAPVAQPLGAMRGVLGACALAACAWRAGAERIRSHAVELTETAATERGRALGVFCGRGLALLDGCPCGSPPALTNLQSRRSPGAQPAVRPCTRPRVLYRFGRCGLIWATSPEVVDRKPSVAIPLRPHRLGPITCVENVPPTNALHRPRLDRVVEAG